MFPPSFAAYEMTHLILQHCVMPSTIFWIYTAAWRPSQGQLGAAAPGPSVPRQLPARPVSGERRYSQPVEAQPAARPGMGLDGGQQGAGPTAEQR